MNIARAANTVHANDLGIPVSIGSTIQEKASREKKKLRKEQKQYICKSCGIAVAGMEKRTRRAEGLAQLMWM